MRYRNSKQPGHSSDPIPRKLGLAIVITVCGGIVAVAGMAFYQEHLSLVRQRELDIPRALELLSTSLQSTDDTDQSTLQRTIRNFNTNITPCKSLRVINRDGIILASIKGKEIGNTNTEYSGIGTGFPNQLEVNALPENLGYNEKWLIRIPIGVASSAENYLECVPREVSVSGRLSNSHIRTGLVGILALGVFWLLYRRLSQHMMGLHEIETSLELHKEHLAEELDELRIGDETNGIARSWNQLINLASELHKEVRSSRAASELAAVLGRGVNGDIDEALNVIPDGILVLDNKTTINYINNGMLHYLGLSKTESPIGTPITMASLSSLGSKIIEQLQEYRVGQGGYRQGNPVLHLPESQSCFQIRIFPINGQKMNNSCVMVVRDISQQIRAEKAREEFVSQVTHELRTPLTNIRAYAETLSSGMFDDPKVLSDCYNVIMAETNRLSRLVEDMLSLSQIEVGTMQLIMDDVDLHRLLTDVVRDMRGQAEEKQIDLQLSLPAKLPIIRADRDKITVILNNLLGNALKYTPSGGEVSVECVMQDETAIIRFTDNGIGIEPSEQETIFERFQRSRNPDVQKVMGTGIGLATAREIAKHHGGDIELESVLGQGSTFTVRIPDAAAISQDQDSESQIQES